MKIRNLMVLAIFAALFLCGCGNTPKQTVKDFINACEKKNFKKAAGMVYWEGNFMKEEELSGRVSYAPLCDFHKFSGVKNGDRVKYELSPREPVFAKDNPNKCRVCVVTTLIRNGRRISSREVSWTLEKVGGKWSISEVWARDWE